MTKTESKEKIPIRDKLVVLGVWGGLVMGIRMILYQVDPFKWLGSLGAIAIAFVVMYVILKYFNVGPFHEKFRRVMLFWYGKKMGVFLIVFTGYNILALTFLEFGYARYGEENLKNGYEPEIFPNFLVKVAWGFAITDAENGGGYRFITWLSFYEEIEIIIFFFLIRKGIIFGKVLK